MHTQTIMLISSNSAGRQTLQQDLQSIGSAMTVSESVIDAIQKLNHVNPQVIVLEASLDHSDFLLDTLPKAGSDEYIPIVLVTTEPEGNTTVPQSVDPAQIFSAPYCGEKLRKELTRFLKPSTAL